MSNDQVLDAELRLYQDSTFSYYPTNWTYTLTVYQITGIKKNKWVHKGRCANTDISLYAFLFPPECRDKVLKKLDTKIISLADEFSFKLDPSSKDQKVRTKESSTSRWLTFNVTSALIHWMENPQENHGLYLRVKCNHFGEFFCCTTSLLVSFLTGNIIIVVPLLMSLNEMKRLLPLSIDRARI